jgi:hypothetical protein
MVPGVESKNGIAVGYGYAAKIGVPTKGKFAFLEQRGWLLGIKSATKPDASL